MKIIPEELKNSELLSGISEEGIAGILDSCEARKLICASGETVIRAGEPADRIGIVLSGVVQIVRTDISGNNSILGRAGAGDIFGESLAFSDEASMPVSVVSPVDSEIMMLRASGLSRGTDPYAGGMIRFRDNLIRIMASKNLSFNRKIEVTSRRTTREKLLAYLSIQARDAGSREFDIPFDRQQLADYLEVDRSGLSAEIGKLRRQGIIESSRSHFKINV
ncbi:MAG: Crp/Fnr family transcriptional regulator [Anaerovoracaceae bacterium]|nr:Crp/Fnr family transcriptional regulator [Anaerovoracaceae bacterium]